MSAKVFHKIMDPAEMFESNLELIATITSTPMEKLRKLPSYDMAYIARATHGELRGVGMTDGQINKLRAAIELNKRVRHEMPKQITAPSDVADYMMGRYQDMDQECFVVIHLNTKNKILSAIELYRGTVNTQNIRIAEVFKEAIKLNAASIIVVHNHPSGDPMPSADDVSVTKSIAEAGKLLDCDLLDHIVIGRGTFKSLREMGAGFHTI